MRLPFRYVSWLLAVGASVAMAQLTLASQIAHDGFNRSFPVYAAGGEGFSVAWAQGGFNVFASGYTYERYSLCYSDLQKSGGSVSGDAFSQINGVIRNLRQPLGADNTTVYASFLLQPRGTLNNGIYGGFFGVTLNGSLGNDLFVGKPGGGASGQYVLENRGGYGQVPSGVTAVVGRTALLVVKAEFRPGNDGFSLYVNPKPEHPEPTSGAVKADLDLGTVRDIGIYSAGAFAVDEIRIGTAFADVVPARGGIVNHGERSDDCQDDDKSHRRHDGQ